MILAPTRIHTSARAITGIGTRNIRHFRRNFLRPVISSVLFTHRLLKAREVK
jgi:hypothetical protein